VSNDVTSNVKIFQQRWEITKGGRALSKILNTILKLQQLNNIFHQPLVAYDCSLPVWRQVQILTCDDLVVVCFQTKLLLFIVTFTFHIFDKNVF
jgi:hypothetical protein